MLAMHDRGLPKGVVGTTPVIVPTAELAFPVTVAARADLPESWAGYAGLLVTPQRAADLDWRLVNGPVVVDAPRPLTAAQRSALGELDQGAYWAEDPYVAEPGTRHEAGPWHGTSSSTGRTGGRTGRWPRVSSSAPRSCWCSLSSRSAGAGGERGP